MKWSTAVSRVSSLGQECQRMASLPSATIPIRVTQLWAAGDILGRPREIDAVTVVLIVDLPADQVPWWCDPVGAGPGVEPPDCSAAAGLG